MFSLTYGLTLPTLRRQLSGNFERFSWIYSQLCKAHIYPFSIVPDEFLLAKCGQNQINQIHPWPFGKMRRSSFNFSFLT
jgi:hypothetical protein